MKGSCLVPPCLVGLNANLCVPSAGLSVVALDTGRIQDTSRWVEQSVHGLREGSWRMALCQRDDQNPPGPDLLPLFFIISQN